MHASYCPHAYRFPCAFTKIPCRQPSLQKPKFHGLTVAQKVPSDHLLRNQGRSFICWICHHHCCIVLEKNGSKTCSTSFEVLGKTAEDQDPVVQRNQSTLTKKEQQHTTFEEDKKWDVIPRTDASFRALKPNMKFLDLGTGDLHLGGVLTANRNRLAFWHLSTFIEKHSRDIPGIASFDLIISERNYRHSDILTACRLSPCSYPYGLSSCLVDALPLSYQQRDSEIVSQKGVCDIHNVRSWRKQRGG